MRTAAVLLFCATFPFMRAAALLAVSAISLAGCQVARGPAPNAPGKTSAAELAQNRKKEPAPRRQAEQIAVDVRVMKLAGGEAVAVTRGELDTDRSMKFETKQSGQVGEAHMTLHVEPRGKGVYAVELDWRETTPEGRVVAWSPTLAVTEGEEATAEIAWSEGDGRRIVLKLTKPEPTEPTMPSTYAGTLSSPRPAAEPAAAEPPPTNDTPDP
jgi:hypothetical protein